MKKSIFPVLCFVTIFGPSAIVCAQAPAAGSPAANRMTVQQAEELAIKNNPQMSVAKLLTLAQGQVVREVRSIELPTATVDLTAVDGNDQGRMSAGALNAPRPLERAGGGIQISQLITDFGRSRNLVTSSQLQARAQASSERATALDIILAVDEAFYGALRAQAQLNIAQQTVTTRQTTADQVGALTQAKLRSELDLAFANVLLAQAKLLLLDAQNQQAAAFANLNAVLGFEKQRTYLLVDETGGKLPSPPPDRDVLLDLAFRSRPDLIALNEQWEAEEHFRRAEHDLSRPTVSALSAFGDTPVRGGAIPPFLSPYYAAAGINVSIPVFTGFLFSARAQEADQRTNVLREKVRDLRDIISRDVQVTWLKVQTTFQQVAVTEQLLQQANLALNLAQSRYKLGLSSVVELSQAVLQQTQAAIGNANAKYDYMTALSALKFQTGQ